LKSRLPETEVAKMKTIKRQETARGKGKTVAPFSIEPNS